MFSSSSVNNFNIATSDKYNHNQHHHNNNSNNNHNNNKLTFMNNEQLLQHRLSIDAAAPTTFSGLSGAMKARNLSSTPSDLDDDSDAAPTPPKLRVSNNVNDAVAALPLATLNDHNVDENDHADVNNRTPQPQSLTINNSNNSSSSNTNNNNKYEHNLPLSLSNNIDADDDDSRLSGKSALKAAFVLQQKEFLIQQQLQQQQHQHQQPQHQQQHLHHTHHHHHNATPTSHQHQHLFDDEHSFDQQYHRSLQYPDVGYLHDADNNGSRQRKERMSKRQKELYVEFLEQNPIVNTHRRNDPVLDGFWLRLANILNDCPNGAAKSVAEWKQAFDNWRYRVFLYARHNSQLNGEDAQLNSKAFKPLTLTDKRAYNLWIRNPDTAPANIEKLPTDLNCSED